MFDSLILIFPSPADSFWGIFSRLIMRLWFCKVMKEVGVCPIEHLSNSQTKEEDTGEEKEKTLRPEQDLKLRNYSTRKF